MAGKHSMDTEKALKLIAKGLSRYEAGKLTGVSPSTLYRSKDPRAMNAMSKVKKAREAAKAKKRN